MAQYALIAGAAALNYMGGRANANAQIYQGQLNNQAMQINANASMMNAKMFEQQGIFQQMLGNYNASVLEGSAAAITKIGEYNASAARGTAAAEADRQSRLTADIISKQRALYGKSGVVTSGGSPLAVLEETAEEGEIDRLLLLREGELVAMNELFSSQLQSNQLRGQAAISRFEGASSRYMGDARGAASRYEAAGYRYQGRAGLAASRFGAKTTLITSSLKSGSMMLSAFSTKVS